MRTQSYLTTQRKLATETQRHRGNADRFGGRIGRIHVRVRSRAPLRGAAEPVGVSPACSANLCVSVSLWLIPSVFSGYSVSYFR